MKIVVLGLTITSSWGNGHATTYRSLLKSLHERGHSIVFFEKDVEWYRSHRDMPRPGFCRVRLYENWTRVAKQVVREAREADAVIIGSYFPDAIAATAELLQGSSAPLLFYDIDTPVTMAELRRRGRTDYLNAADIPHYAAYMSFTGGPALRELEEEFRSPFAVALYCSVDVDLYRKTRARRKFRCAMSYLGTYAKDRQLKLVELMNRPAAALSSEKFLVAGPMYPEDLIWPLNVQRLRHVGPPDHPSFYSSARFTLNLTRAAMVKAGYSPSVRLFEAAACGACIISDEWAGLGEFFKVGSEILVAGKARDVTEMLTGMSEAECAEIGLRAQARVRRHSTAHNRAAEFENIVRAAASEAPDQRRKIESSMAVPQV